MLTQNNMRMLQLMLEIGSSKDVVAALLDLGGVEKPHLQYMAGPVVVYDSGFSETMPEWICPAIYTERLEQIRQEVEQGVCQDLATVTEVAGYMYSRTLAAPMSHEWVNVYLWCCNQALTKHKRVKSGKSLDDLLDGQIPSSLSDYEQQQYLQPLQRWLRTTICKAAADRGVSKPHHANSTTLKVKQAQTSLFDFE